MDTTTIHPLTTAQARHDALDAAINAMRAEAAVITDIRLGTGAGQDADACKLRILNAQRDYDQAVTAFMRATITRSDMQRIFFAAMREMRADIEAHGMGAFRFGCNSHLVAQAAVGSAINHAADVALGYSS